jgi:hypothetical protein
MRFLLIIIILTSSAIMVLNTFDFHYIFAYSQQLKQQSSSEKDINFSKVLNTTTSDNSNSSKLNKNEDLANYLGYQYEYNFY